MVNLAVSMRSVSSVMRQRHTAEVHWETLDVKFSRQSHALYQGDSHAICTLVHQHPALCLQ